MLDFLYYCTDPFSESNVLECDPETKRWNLDALQAQNPPDRSAICQELIDILVDAHKGAGGTTDGQSSTSSSSSQILSAPLEELLNTVVVDSLKPCVLWAMQYGPLAPVTSTNNAATVDGDVVLVNDQVELQDDGKLYPIVHSFLIYRCSTVRFCF